MQKLSVTAEMIFISVAFGGIAIVLGRPTVAVALVCVLPLSLFQSRLTLRGIAGESATRLILVTLGRTAVGLLVLTTAFFVNTDALIGALLGLTLEAQAHIVAGIRRLMTNR